MLDTRITETKRLSAHRPTPTPHERTVMRVRASLVRKPDVPRTVQLRPTASR